MPLDIIMSQFLSPSVKYTRTNDGEKQLLAGNMERGKFGCTGCTSNTELDARYY